MYICNFFSKRNSKTDRQLKALRTTIEVCTSKSKGKRHLDFNRFQHKLKIKERRSNFGFSYPHN